MKGVLYIISGPAGVGKGTIVSNLIKKNSNLKLSISKTTRKPRFNEIDGVNYFFTTKEDFEKEIKEGNFLEYAIYNNNYYGTPKDFVLKTLNEGHDVILEIETQGALSVKQNFDDSVLIFILPPSLTELKNRLYKRGTETDDEINARLNIAQKEIEKIHLYDYFIINDYLDNAVDIVEKIIIAEKQRTKRFDVKQFLKE
ncbi:guanylate kinase [Caldicellulosiruptoraceae bacterium PP1]